MKTRMMWVSLLALMAACGGPVQQEEETLGEQPSALAQRMPGDESIASGGPCGTNSCGKGTFCCNPGCGVCAPLGGGCPQVVCD